MICPRCAGEFVDGVDRCPDCEVPLEERVEEDRPEPTNETEESSAGSVVVLRTGKLFEADLAASLLEEAGVAHYRQEQSSGGLAYAMPAAPSAGPGTWWVIRVPEEAGEQARAILETHPFELDEPPGVWDFGPTREAKSVFKSWAFLWLLLFALAIVAGLLQGLRELF